MGRDMRRDMGGRMQADTVVVPRIGVFGDAIGDGITDGCGGLVGDPQLADNS
jgi:hypothetical protein